MLPNSKVQNLISRHAKLENELSVANIDKKSFAEKSKEYSDLNEIISEAKEYIKFNSTKKDLENIIEDKNSDSEMIDLAKSELEKLLKRNQYNEKKIKFFYYPKMMLILKMQ